MRALVVISLCLSVIALGAVVFAPGTAAPVAAAPAPGVDPSELKLLEKRVAQLEDDHDHLYRRLREVELAASAASADAGHPWAVAPSSLAGLAENPQTLKDAVKNVQAEIEREQTAARVAMLRHRFEQTPEQRQAKWKAFAADAGMTWAQEQALLGRVEDEYTRRSAIMSDVQNGSRPREDLRGTLQQISRDTEEELKKTLDAAQFEKFKVERRSMNRPNFRREN